jgi:hypothetical protein
MGCCSISTFRASLGNGGGKLPRGRGGGAGTVRGPNLRLGGDFGQFEKNSLKNTTKEVLI